MKLVWVTFFLTLVTIAYTRSKCREGEPNCGVDVNIKVNVLHSGGGCGCCGQSGCDCECGPEPVESTTTTPRVPTTTTRRVPTTTTRRVPTTTPSVCNGEIDIVWLVDESGSIGPNDFQEEKDFVKQFMNESTISWSNSMGRSAMVRFSTSASILWDFDGTNHNLANYNQLIDSFSQTTGLTDIEGALAVAFELLLQQGRQCVPQRIILLTDGMHSVGHPGPSSIMPLLDATDIEIFAIGIGNGINRNELNMITGDPARVFLTSFGGALMQITDTINSAICNSTVLGTCIPTVPSYQGCLFQVNWETVTESESGHSVYYGNTLRCAPNPHAPNVTSTCSLMDGALGGFDAGGGLGINRVRRACDPSFDNIQFLHAGGQNTAVADSDGKVVLRCTSGRLSAVYNGTTYNEVTSITCA